MTVIEPVDWDLAARTAARLARRHTLPPFRDPGLPEQFGRLVATAEELVAAETGLVPAGPATAIVVDRATWAVRNVASFRRLLTPFTERHRRKFAAEQGRLARFSLATGARVTAVELGAMFGWMSSRVIGQYDMLIADEEESDRIFVVGPNLVGLEHRYGFPAAEFRLWIAIHEVTHRSQFTGVPWLRGHFLEQIEELFGQRDGVDLLAVLRAAVSSPGESRRRIREGGLAAVLATGQQRQALGRLAAMMSLLEGHGDIVMNRAGADLIPSAERFERVLGERRRRGNPIQRMIYRLIGFEAKLNQYAAGASFIRAIEQAGGPRVIDRCWTGPDALPTMEEIGHPRLWLDRMGSVGPAASEPAITAAAHIGA